MKQTLDNKEKRIFFIYFIVMVLLLIAIEIAQLNYSLAVNCLLKTFPAVLTAIMGLRLIIKNGMPKTKDKYLALAVLSVGVADILLCFFVGTVPIMSQAPGFTAFCVMQVLLMIWLGVDLKSGLLHVGTVILILGAAFFAHKVNWTTLPALINIGLLTGNLIQGAIIHHQRKSVTTTHYLIAAIGIAVCDYSILIREVFSSEIVQNIFTELAWLGYIPYLIALLLTLVSSYKKIILYKREI